MAGHPGGFRKQIQQLRSGFTDGLFYAFVYGPKQPGSTGNQGYNAARDQLPRDVGAATDQFNQFQQHGQQAGLAMVTTGTGGKNSQHSRQSTKVRK